MEQNRNDSSARVGGSDTGPLPPQGSPPNYGGQPTTYVPPEIRPQGTYSGNYAGETPSAQVPPPYQPYPPYAPPQPVPVAGPPPHNHRHHRAPLLGPLLLISAGVLFLLNNLGVVPWTIWETLGRLWPLILIAIGIDLVVGRRSPAISLLLVLAVVGTGAAIVYANSGFTAPGTLASAPLNIRMNNADWANVHVDMGVGNLTLGSMSGEADLLATGNLDYYENRGAPHMDVSESGGAAEVEISEPSGGWHFVSNWFNGGRSPGWEINLNERVPIGLDVDAGTGNMTLNLERLQLRSLTVDSGTGNTSITLPATAYNTTVEIDGGTGNLELFVPEGLEARIEVDSGIGNTTVDPRFSSQGEDTYESRDYDTAANKVTIKIDHGVGNLNIRSK
ncbi:MAG: DUF5668 domain-containing protein [Chloroflexota bacterium]|nr:DUF5668 domain-containing protein [Chloroflexota bacterium]